MYTLNELLCTSLMTVVLSGSYSVLRRLFELKTFPTIAGAIIVGKLIATLILGL